MSNCEFCQPTPENFPHFKEFGKDRIDLKVLWETDNLIVKPDILPAGEFHALVVPKLHEYSFARVAVEEEEYGNLLLNIKEAVGDIAVFEHGGFKHGGKVQSVYHAHQHLIGTSGLRVLEYMETVGESEGVSYAFLEGVDECPLSTLRGFDLQEKGYFYIQQGRNALLAVDEEDSFPSQIAQRNMSLLLSGRVLNWKNVDKDEELAKLSVARISNIIERCKE